MRRAVLSLLFLSIIFWGGTHCGSGSGGDSCDAVAQTGCGAGQVCEPVVGGTFECFEPVTLRGMVFDLADDSAIEGARVVARDANGAPVSSVAVTDANGNYELSVSSTRDANGNPTDKITLRCDAQGYQTFPSGVRQALPIDLSTATPDANNLSLESPLTMIGMIALEPGAGTGIIRGTVEKNDSTRGALVVAESAPDTGYTGLADQDGNFAIFNLPAGNYTVQAYSRGANYNSASVALGAGEEIQVNLTLLDTNTSTLNGKVEIVNPGQGKGTSIILVVESTFIENLARGEVPPGLRVPAEGVEPNITGSFSMEGVPAGRYVILAAFENDFLVRDPDTCISGTDLVYQTVGTGETIDLDQSFKITGALDVISPGAGQPQEVGPNPTFTWADDSSEDEYRVKVFDTFGNLIWETTTPGTSGSDPMVDYAGPPLESGMYYQFRATSVRIKPMEECEISQTEDLKGVFFLP